MQQLKAAKLKAAEEDAVKAKEKERKERKDIEVEVGAEILEHHGADHRGVEIQPDLRKGTLRTPQYHTKIESNIYVHIIIGQEDVERRTNAIGDMIIVCRNRQR